MTTPGQRDRDARPRALEPRPGEAFDVRRSLVLDALIVTDERATAPETAAQRRRRGTAEALTRWMLRRRANG